LHALACATNYWLTGQRIVIAGENCGIAGRATLGHR
jgi:hypothetical protein